MKDLSVQYSQFRRLEFQGWELKRSVVDDFRGHRTAQKQWTKLKNEERQVLG